MNEKQNPELRPIVMVLVLGLSAMFLVQVWALTIYPRSSSSTSRLTEQLATAVAVVQTATAQAPPMVTPTTSATRIPADAPTTDLTEQLATAAAGTPMPTIEFEVTPLTIPTLAPPDDLVSPLPPLPDAVVTVSALNVRTGPGVTYDRIGVVRQGDELEVAGQAYTCGWLQVVTPKGTKGWVSAPYVFLNLPCYRIRPGTIPPTLAPRRRLPTGTLVQDAGRRNGRGELTIENGRDLDAVAALTILNEVPVVSVYIRAGDSFTVTGIQDGTYYLYFTLGEDWDSGSARFTRKSRFFRFEDTLTFQTSPTVEGWLYSTIRVTLHPVVGGTAETLPVDAGQFPNLK